MSSEPARSRIGPTSPAASNRNDTWNHGDPTSLLDTLGDEYARAAFEAVLDHPKSGREVAAATDMSRPTAFRRLNALVDLGLLETEQRIEADNGHHHKVYRPVVNSFAVTIDDGGIEIEVESDRPTGAPFDGPGPILAND